jgi:hypothetical protein
VHFADVEIPDELLRAQRDGNLVVFAGAGVSIPSPSDLPTFEDLVRELAVSSGAELHPNELPEIYLGRLARTTQYPVDREVANIIGRSTSKPSALHSEIIHLFPEASDVRIVTTNFDGHFSSAAIDRWPEGVPEFTAPALPPGDTFSGIVYVHGKVGDPRSSLVVTDEDFGIAYLTRGYARRFLVELFQHNHVLFVGYSHSDAVLTYLARGLPFGTPARYALTKESSVAKWNALGVEPIVFPSQEPQHEPLVEAFARWGRYVAWGFADHEREIARLVANGPDALDPQSSDYLQSRIEDPDTASLFSQHAGEPSWLLWASAQPAFTRLFTSTIADDEVSRALARWFAEKFATRHPMNALGTVARLGGRMSRECWYAVAQEFHGDRPQASVLAMWVPVLLENAPVGTYDFLDYLLKASRPNEDDDSALALFDFLTTPRLKLSVIPAIFTEDGSDQVGFDLEVPGDAYWLNEAVKDIFHPRIEVFAKSLLAIATRQFERAYEFARLFGARDVGWDWVSLRRPAIELDEYQPGTADWWDALVDAARAAIDWAQGSSPALARQYMDIWTGASAPMLKRLAIYTAQHASWLRADDKLQWLNGTGWLFAVGLRHEVYRLLGDAYRAASSQSRAQTLAAIDAGPSPEFSRQDDERDSRTAFDLLNRLSEEVPSDESLETRIGALIAEHPDWAPDPHADEVVWSEEIGPEGKTPFTPQELLSIDTKDSMILDALLTYEVDDAQEFATVRDWFNSPRRGLLETVSVVATQHPEWGLALARELIVRSEWRTDLWSALIEGWTEGSLDESSWFEILGVLSVHQDLGSHVRPVARLLEKGAQATYARESAAVAVSDPVALQAWESLPDETGPIESDEWLTTAINHPAGQLGIYFLRTSADPSGTGLRAERYELFEGWTIGKTYSDALARTILASQLHFLHSRDRSWAIKSITPHLNWDADALTARQMWDGFLVWSKLNPTLVDDLTPYYVSAFSHTEDFDRLRDRFTEYVAAATFLRSTNPMDPDWLPFFVQRSRDEDVSSWTMHVAGQLRSLQPEDRSRAWSDWIANYWNMRNRGIPRPMSRDEARAIVEWSIHLPDVFDDAVDLASRTIEAGARSVFYSELQSVLESAASTSVARLLRHVLKGEERPFWHCLYVCPVATTLAQRTERDEGVIRDIVEELLRLQCSCADEVASFGVDPSQPS